MASNIIPFPTRRRKAFRADSWQAAGNVVSLYAHVAEPSVYLLFGKHHAAMGIPSRPGIERLPPALADALSKKCNASYDVEQHPERKRVWAFALGLVTARILWMRREARMGRL